MSSINGVGNLGNTVPVQQTNASPVQKQVPTAAPAQNRAGDSVQLSGVQHLLQALKTNNVRADKVASIRSQIEAGTYEDDHKLEVASDRLLDDLFK